MANSVTAADLPDAGRSVPGDASRQLSIAARGWYAATALGQLMFIGFILLFYYARTLSGNLESWNAKPLITGYVAGDAIGNGNFALHVLAAGVMALAGLLQLVPVIRRRWPGVHRWSGRTFLLMALILSLGGLWLTWVRGSYLAVTGAVAISIDAALILWFGAMAWRTARQRNFMAHRRWALRTFIVASGVWFMRVGYMAWGIATGGAGVGPSMNGPFDLIWAFATYLLPLAVLELYFRAERATPGVQRAMAAGLWSGSAVILFGSIGAWFIMWSPYIG
jgi:Predicted membrane protein (DUF2306)